MLKAEGIARLACGIPTLRKIAVKGRAEIRISAADSGRKNRRLLRQFESLTVGLDGVRRAPVDDEESWGGDGPDERSSSRERVICSVTINQASGRTVVAGAD